MTVNTTNITSGPYSGNGITTEFSYTFRIEDKTQLVAYLTGTDGAVSTLTVDGDYAVNGIGDDNGGTITLTTPPATGETLFIRSDYKLTQLTDFDSQGGFFPDVHESSFDKLTFLIQQQNDILKRRALLFDDSFDRTELQNKIPAPELNKVLAWDVDGSLYNSDGSAGNNDNLERYDSVAAFVTSTPSDDLISVTSYYAGWAASVNGPAGGFKAHKTGASNTSPSFGTAVSVSSIGGGDGTGSTTGQASQIGFYWDASGVEWRIEKSKKYELSQFGARGSGDETTEIQDALTFVCNQKATLVSQPGASYTIGNVILDGCNDCRFFFLGSTFNLTGTASGNGLGFEVRNNATNMKFLGATIVGDGVVANKHKGLWSDSGPTWHNVEIAWNNISGVINGVSVNANLSGSIKNVEIHNNNVTNVVGTNTGQGYGIHWAYLGTTAQKSVHCHHNTVDQAQRHSIYCASGGRSQINSNIITNHRQGVAGAVNRAAINILRGDHVKVFDNELYDGYDGYITCAGETFSTAPSAFIEVYRNKFINRRNIVQYVTIGEETWPQSQTSKVWFYDNYIYQDHSLVTGGNGVVIHGGQNIRFNKNVLEYDNIPSGTQIFIKLGNSAITADSDLTDVEMRKNEFIANGSFSSVRCISAEAPVCTNTSTHRIFDNILKGPNVYINFVSAQTNPNFWHDQWTSLTFNSTWANQAGSEAVKARLTSSGRVQLKGRANPNGSASTTVASLPVHCEPLPSGSRNILTSTRDDAGFEPLQINTTTRDVIVGAVPASWLSLEGVEFNLNND